MDEKKNASAPAPGMDPKTKKILIGVGIGVGATVGAVGAIVAAPFALAGERSGGLKRSFFVFFWINNLTLSCFPFYFFILELFLRRNIV